MTKEKMTDLSTGTNVDDAASRETEVLSRFLRGENKAQHVQVRVIGANPPAGDETDGFFVGQKGGPPIEPRDVREAWVVGDEVHLLIHPDVVIDVGLFDDPTGPRLDVEGEQGQHADALGYTFLREMGYFL